MKSRLKFQATGICIQLQVGETPILIIDEVIIEGEGEAAAQEITDYFGGMLKALSGK